MICPQCSMKNRITDRICARCGFMPELGVSIETAPPRAESGRATTQVSRLRMRQLREPKQRPRQILTAQNLWVIRLVLGIVPGLGHLLGRRYILGLFYFTLVACLYSYALILAGDNMQIFIGLTAAAHAHSMFTVVPSEARESFYVRVMLMGCLVIGLLQLFYWPMSYEIVRSAAMQRHVVNPVYIDRSGADIWHSIMIFIFVAFLAGFAGLAAGIVRDAITSRRERKSS